MSVLGLLPAVRIRGLLLLVLYLLQRKELNAISRLSK
jgi:hypothetical protein